MARTRFLLIPLAAALLGACGERLDLEVKAKIDDMVAHLKEDPKNVFIEIEGHTDNVGTPAIKGAHVTGEIVKQGKGEKIVVFKQKRRKNYAKKQGHRQGFTEVRIKDIAFGKKSGGEK